MAHYDIFRDQLATRFSAHGYALWEPSPVDPSLPTSIGDVGYINEGRFYRLFNILLPADDSSHLEYGVPANHQPFNPKVSNHIVPGILRPDNFCSAGVTHLESDRSGYLAKGPNKPGEVMFSLACRERQGAVLCLPIQAKRENTVVREGFGKWMIKHIDQWFAWTLDREFGIKQMEDIILLTGTDRTRSWANVAFLGGQADARVSFSVEATHSKINWQFSPECKTGAAWHWGPSGENLSKDQCIFIRGFRVRKRMRWLPRKLKAAAEPHPDSSDDESEPDAKLVSIPALPKYRDPLHVMLEYIAEERPTCDMVIVHDDDLARLDLLSDGASLEALLPDVVLNCLRSSKLAIHEIVFGSDLSTDNSAGTADMEVVRVASLSATFEGEYSRIPDSESGHLTTMRSLQSPLVTSTTDTVSCPPGPSTSTMPQVSSTTPSSSTLETTFRAALETYNKQTKRDIASHPLTTQLQSCDTPDAIIAVLRAQVQSFDQSQSADEKWTNWLVPTVHVLYAYSATLGISEGPIFPHLIAIFAGIGVLLQAIKNVRAGQGALVDLFGRIENSFQRLVAYTEVRPTTTMTDGIVKTMIEVLLILGTLTKEAGQGRTRKLFKKLVGKKDVEDSVQRLDKLTQEVARLAETEVQVLTATRRNDNEMKVVDNRVEDFNREVHEIGQSPQQCGSKPRHESPRGEGPTHDVDQSTQALTFLSSSSSGLYSDFGRTGAAARPLLQAAHPHTRRPLTPTVRQVISEDFRFRILVVGKRGSGKSSLIKAVFKINVPAAQERSLGKDDINFEYCPEDNRYLAVHECSGLEPGAVDSQNIRDFISHRTDPSRSASERLHAVWICIPASDAIDGKLGEGAEDILSMKSVPVILVLTKFDVVVSKVLSDTPRDDAQQCESARAKALAMYEESCRRLFQKDPRDVPAEIVSENPRYADLVDNLVVTTDRYLMGSPGPLAGFGAEGERSRVSAVPLAWSAALRVSQGIVLETSVTVGRTQYWQHLWSNVYFADHSLQSCVNIIHVDLVEIWNLNDKTRYLSSDGFKAKMSHFVKDLVAPASMISDPNSAATGPGVEIEFADWVHHEYKGSPENVRCIMGYIVDLTVILDAIFSAASGDVSQEDVLLVIDRHVSSGKKDKIHRHVQGFVTQAFDMRFSVPQNDLILERIIDLISESCATPGNRSILTPHKLSVETSGK